MSNEEDRQNQCIHAFCNEMDYLNRCKDDYAKEIIEASINAVIGHVYYTRVNPSGPRRKDLIGDFPLVDWFLIFLLHFNFFDLIHK